MVGPVALDLVLRLSNPVDPAAPRFVSYVAD
jgi:hypothetical protein